MKAITLPSFGGPEVLTPSDVPAPEIAPDEVLVDVVAAGVNRADLLQRQGHYPPPPGESELPGLEVSGRIATLGADVDGWSVGDEVCALLAGGGYAEQVAVPAGQLLPVPEGVSLVDAAALPEVVCTVWSNLVMTARLQPDETLLVHGGSSGIGTMAIQLARCLGSEVAVTAGSADKLEVCRELGASVLVDYKEQDFVEELKAVGGADVILDNMGAKYLDRNVSALAPGGRLVIIGMQGGVKAELNIGRLLAKRGAVIATSLRARPRSEKAAVVDEVREHVWPLVESGEIRPIVHARFPMAEVAAAHEELDKGTHIGKVLLLVGDAEG
ncbi:NAD(P)H-quinone oxidoreductase [Arsenicicoccus dermatophilus]|uniref:NAD(P)H-quinone oxidoreductase n=1 Tax=Arsenicicoccus dermatophilus TaxID=1076331 RepID=UPI001F4CC006|nr:NAD(P)H-quinone oxidoreductase [Arsenicicoccus dermatophilus]MCH8614238.1 NAD(P)H-quinone oxidoreductase [Arsenicicoccus dermatophilus]